VEAAAVPETKYAKSGDVHLAYQVLGTGPVDLVFFGAAISHIELWWEEPSVSHMLRRLARFTRLIVFDKRGTGMSDPISINELPTLEQRLEDVCAIMDAAGSRDATLFGNSEGVPLGVLYATTYPERTRGLILHSGGAGSDPEADYPIGLPPSVFEAFLEFTEKHWGDHRFLEFIAPSLASDERTARWWCQFMRRTLSPGLALAQFRMNYAVDVRDLLPLVQAPTLVLHARDEQFMPIEQGRYLAEHIPGARLVELPGADHLPFGDAADLIVDEIQEFLTGIREPAEPDRVLATILFSDIASSTEQLAALGDRRWREVLSAHDQAVRRQLERFRGTEIKTTGDGFLARFDGPARAIRCGVAIREAARMAGLEVRVGIHAGEIELREDHDISGLAVHIGARVAALGNGGDVLVSSSVPPLVVGSGIQFSDRGPHELKGVPGSWQIFAVEQT
jgi:pimeloyl-ACP methyl ester carboxylesterase